MSKGKGIFKLVEENPQGTQNSSVGSDKNMIISNKENEEKKDEENINESTNNNIITQNGMKIIKNYKRVSHNDINNTSTQDEEEIKCPLCNSLISKEKFQEHLKLELLDPKWKEIQREIDKRKENSTLANGEEFLYNLNNFTKQRPDLFDEDNNNKNAEIKEEENLNHNNIFSGFNPYMNRTTAIIKKFHVQNQRNVAESLIAHKNDITNSNKNNNQ